MTQTAPHPTLGAKLATLECKASQGRIVVYVGDLAADAQSKALADARAFGIELGEKGTFNVRLVAEDELPSVADVLHSAFAFPLQVDGPVHLGTDVGDDQGAWTVDAGSYWGALYEVFPDCEESIGAQYVIVLSKEDTLPAPRWSALPHLTDADRTPEGASFPEALALPGDAMDDTALPDLRALFGGASGAGGGGSDTAPTVRKSDPAAKKTADNVASRLFAAIASLDDDLGDEDFEDDDFEDDLGGAPAPEQHDPFVKLIKTLVADKQLDLVEGASARKLAERLELALERDPMMFQRPGDWFFDQDEVDELYASDDELMAAIRGALNG